MAFSDRRVAGIVKFLKNFYLVIGCLSIVLLIPLYFALQGVPKTEPISAALSPAIFLSNIATGLYYLVIFFFLRSKRSWVPIVMIVLSAISLLRIAKPLIGGIVNYLAYFSDWLFRWAHPFYVLAACLLIFQIYFFAQKEVRNYFKR